MKAVKDLIRRIPSYGWVCGFVYFGLQYGIYRLADWLSRVTGTIEHAWLPKIPLLDDRIPLIPFFITIYVFSYIFWIMGPMFASLCKKKDFVNYIIGLSAAYLIGALIFIFFPSYMDRAAEGLMEKVSGPGIWNAWLRSIYEADGGNLAFNLFPSYHCLISLYCYLGIRKHEEVPKGIRIYSIIMTVLICMSTVFTKQHYLIDIFGGLSIALVCYIVTEKLDPASRILEKEKQA